MDPRALQFTLLYSSVPQRTPVYSNLSKCTPVYSGVLSCTLVYYNVLRRTPVYSCVFQRTPVYSCVLDFMAIHSKCQGEHIFPQESGHLRLGWGARNVRTGRICFLVRFCCLRNFGLRSSTPRVSERRSLVRAPFTASPVLLSSHLSSRVPFTDSRVSPLSIASAVLEAVISTPGFIGLVDLCPR